MIRRNLSVVFIALAGCVLAQQLDSNSITVYATRNTNVQPDQAIFAVFLDAGPDIGLPEAVALLEPIGIATDSFSSVSTVPQYSQPSDPSGPPMLEWAFALPVPLAKIKATAAQLAALQQSIAGKKNGTSLAFSVVGTLVSQPLQQSQTCSISDLLADARAQAQKFADAAQATLGPILAITGSAYSSVGNPASSLSVSRYSVTNSGFYSAPTCAVTVKYGLTRF